MPSTMAAWRWPPLAKGSFMAGGEASKREQSAGQRPFTCGLLGIKDVLSCVRVYVCMCFVYALKYCIDYECLYVVGGAALFQSSERSVGVFGTLRK